MEETVEIRPAVRQGSAGRLVLPCRPEQLPSGLVGDITACKACGDVLRVRDAGGEYAGVACHFFGIPEERVLPEARCPAGMSTGEWLERMYDRGLIWAVCSACRREVLAAG